MRRDTPVFALAGVVFGFVVGYMTSSWGQPVRAARPLTAGAASSAAVPEAPAPTLDPNEEGALVALAERDPGNVAVRVELGRTDEAVAVWEEALRRHPDYPQLQGLRARVGSIHAASGGGRP